MKNLITLIKSDNWLMLISIILFVLAALIIAQLCRMYPVFFQTLTIIIGVSLLTGLIISTAALYFVYKIERACDNNN